MSVFALRRMEPVSTYSELNLCLVVRVAVSQRPGFFYFYHVIYFIQYAQLRFVPLSERLFCAPIFSIFQISLPLHRQRSFLSCLTLVLSLHLFWRCACGRPSSCDYYFTKAFQSRIGGKQEARNFPASLAPPTHHRVLLILLWRCWKTPERLQVPLRLVRPLWL